MTRSPAMSETTTPPQPGGQAQTPPLVVNIQYVKDLSFEVPGAPQVFTQLRSQPQVNINLDVQARRIQNGQSIFEVSLVIRAEAQEPPAQGTPQGTPQGAPQGSVQGAGQGAAAGGNGQDATPVSAPANTVFVAELTYAGV